MEKTNRRKSQRRRPRTSVKIECRKGAFGMGPNLASSALDVSTTGARLIVVRALEVKGEVELVIAGYGMSKPIKRSATIIWQVELADGGFCVGAEFQKRLDYRDWQNFAAAS